MNNGIRFVAFIVDHFVACAISVILFFGLTFAVNFSVHNIYDSIYIFFVIYYILMVCKDLVFRNASIGKKILKLKIVNESNCMPNIAIVVLRNIFFLIWPIEVIVLLVKGKKIEDIIFKTKVIKVEKKFKII